MVEYLFFVYGAMCKVEKTRCFSKIKLVIVHYLLTFIRVYDLLFGYKMSRNIFSFTCCMKTGSSIAFPLIKRVNIQQDRQLFCPFRQQSSCIWTFLVIIHLQMLVGVSKLVKSSKCYSIS